MIYVLTVRGGAELETAELIRSKGYEAYVPRIMKRYRRKKDVVFTAEPMFPGYMFVYLNRKLTAEDYYSIKNLRAVSRFLSTETYLPASESEYIEVLCREGTPIGISKGYVENGTLHITEGWLTKFQHRIIRWSVRQHKAVVEFNIYGVPHKITSTVDITQKTQSLN